MIAYRKSASNGSKIRSLNHFYIARHLWRVDWEPAINGGLYAEQNRP